MDMNWFESHIQTLTHMGYGGGGSMVLLGLLPHQLVDWGQFAEASVDMKLVHVGQRRVGGGRRYVAPRGNREMRQMLKDADGACVRMCVC